MIKLYKKEFDKLEAKEIFGFEVSNPDYKSLVDLAQINYCKFLSPKILDDKNIIARFEKLDTKSSFHNDIYDKEKYGINSTFATINKLNQVSFLHYYLQALQNVKNELKF